MVEGRHDREGTGLEVVHLLDIVDGTDITTLAGAAETPCVSLYLPTQRAGPETRQGPIRFGNLLTRARSMLDDLGMRSTEADELLEDARSLEADHEFWQHQEEALAVLVSPGTTRTYRLGSAVSERTVVADGFHLTPLIHEAAGNDRFLILALSRNRVRLLWGRRHRIGEIAVPDPIPESLAEALWFEDREKQLQHQASDRTGRGRVAATFHGHGVPEEDDEARLERFLRKVDAGLDSLVSDEPIVLAGVAEITSLYRHVSDRDSIVDDTVRGNPDDATPRDLHGRAWSIVEPALTGGETRDRTAFEESPALAMTDLDEILTAALAGRIDAVWVSLDDQVWGTASPAGEIASTDEQGAGDRDLTDLAAIEVWRRSGRVHVVDEIPGGGAIAALARYAP